MQKTAKSPKLRRLRRRYTGIGLVGLSIAGLDAEIRRGINVYRRGIRPWLLFDSEHDRSELDSVKARKPAGYIANITDQRIHDEMASVGQPVVDVSGLVGDGTFPLVQVDNVHVGRVGAEHLMARGFERFVYVSNGREVYEADRWQGFAEELARHQLEASWVRRSGSEIVDPRGRVHRIRHEMMPDDWLTRMPLPLAVFASVDIIGSQVCDACFALDLAVPEQVAVLGVDDNLAVCEACNPMLSSVKLPGEKIGYEAARLLEAMMAGGVGRSVTPLPPLGVSVRESTDVMAIADQDVARALGFIREHAAERVSITQVAQAAGMNRRTLEKRFRDVVGRTMLEELFRVRVDLARRRLVSTDESVYVIAINSGFRDAESLANHFKRRHQQTPTEYRRQFRIR